MCWVGVCEMGRCKSVQDGGCVTAVWDYAIVSIYDKSNYRME